MNGVGRGGVNDTKGPVNGVMLFWRDGGCADGDVGGEVREGWCEGLCGRCKSRLPLLLELLLQRPQLSE